MSLMSVFRGIRFFGPKLFSATALGYLGTAWTPAWGGEIGIGQPAPADAALEASPRQEDTKRPDQAQKDLLRQVLEEDQHELEEARRRREARTAGSAAEQATRDAQIVGSAQASWANLIAIRVRKFWQRPAASADAFSCMVEVKLNPDASVAQTRVLRSCGSTALDRSVEQAVMKASPLPPPPDPRAMPVDQIIKITFCPSANAC